MLREVFLTPMVIPLYLLIMQRSVLDGGREESLQILNHLQTHLTQKKSEQVYTKKQMILLKS